MCFLLPGTKRLKVGDHSKHTWITVALWLLFFVWSADFRSISIFFFLLFKINEKRKTLLCRDWPALLQLLFLVASQSAQSQETFFYANCDFIYWLACCSLNLFSLSDIFFKYSPLPENFLGAQTLEVCTNRVETLKCGLHTQGSKHILWAHFVEVKGYTGYVFPITWLGVDLGFQHKGTLDRKADALYHIQQFCYFCNGVLGDAYSLWSPCLSRLQSHEHGVIRQGNEKFIRVHLSAIFLTDQRQRNSRQGQQQSLTNLEHKLRSYCMNAIPQLTAENSHIEKFDTIINRWFKS